MDWVGPLVLLIALSIGTGFTLLQFRTMWAEVRVTRRERLAHPDPNRKRHIIRALVIVIAVYGLVGMAFYLGWRRAGLSGGVIAAASTATVGVLVMAAVALKSAWVPPQ
jgi:hypothetical protein